MKTLAVLATLVAASIIVLASGSEEASLVIDRTGGDFTSWLKSHPVALVMFYSLRNPLSQHLVPLFETLAATMKPAVQNAAFARIDCTSGASKEACLPYFDDGFPKYTVFKDGHPWTGVFNLLRHANDDEELHKRAWKRAAAEIDNPNFNINAFSSYLMPILNKAMTELLTLQTNTELEDRYPIEDITGIDFSAWLNNHPTAMVMFYSPRSADYLTVLRYYGAFAAGLQKSNPYVNPVKIDCTAESSKEACLPYFDSGYPTFTFFNDGQPWSGEESPLAYRIREEHLHIESVWDRGSVENDYIFQTDHPMFNAPSMASFRKAMAELSVLMKENSDKSTSEDLLSPSKGATVYLTGGDFSTRTKSHPFAFVMFYTPRSPYYRRLQTFFDSSTHVLEETFPDTMIAKIDCSLVESEDVCEQQVGSAIPSFAVFKDGIIYENIQESRDRQREAWSFDFEIIDAEMADLQDAEFMGPLKNALAALVEVHREMTDVKQLKTRGEEL